MSWDPVGVKSESVENNKNYNNAFVFKYTLLSESLITCFISGYIFLNLNNCRFLFVCIYQAKHDSRK